MTVVFIVSFNKKQLQKHTAGQLQYLGDTEDIIQKDDAQVQ